MNLSYGYSREAPELLDGGGASIDLSPNRGFEFAKSVDGFACIGQNRLTACLIASDVEAPMHDTH